MISYFDWPLVRHVVWLTVGLLVTAVAIALLVPPSAVFNELSRAIPEEPMDPLDPLPLMSYAYKVIASYLAVYVVPGCVFSFFALPCRDLYKALRDVSEECEDRWNRANRGLVVSSVVVALLLTAAIAVLVQNPWNLGGSPWASTLLILVMGIGMLLLPTWSYRRVAGEDIKASLP
jgi:hypothetical protein